MKKITTKRFFLLPFIVLAMCLLAVHWESSTVRRHVYAQTGSAFQPLKSAEGALVRLAAIGDTRSGDWRQKQIATLLDRISQMAPVDGILLLGDNTSLRGTAASAMERSFSVPYEPLIKRQVPFYAVLGNHDLRGHMKEYQMNFSSFNMNGRPYYSKVFGGNIAELFFLDSNTILKDPQQVGWLEETLKQSSAEWKVVAMHHPVYTTARRHLANAQLTQLLEPIFLKYGVDIVLAGHNHIYERLNPINGVTYFTAGSGGLLKDGDLKEKSPSRAAGNDTDNVALFLEFTPEILRFQACTADGIIVDEGTIKQPSGVAEETVEEEGLIAEHE